MNHEQYMSRCLQLALKGAGSVAPNPMVGAVLVHNDRIIGEGWHRQYGEAHAEVNCIASVKKEDQSLIASSVLYVSLEPCAHFGKTPPCADLIVSYKIPTVVIGCRDSYKEVAGKGIEKLKANAVDVTVGILEQECRELNRRFFTFHEQQRPYIILKWAQSADHKIGGTGERVLISNNYSNRLVHQWRSEEAAILVGTNTALKDNPSLTTRLYPGRSPLRLVIDKQLNLPASLQLLDGSLPTVVFNQLKEEEEGVISYKKVNEDDFIKGMLQALYEMKVQSVLVEGGNKLLQSFIDAGCWDEARVITNNDLQIGEGTNAPALLNAQKTGDEQFSPDTITYYRNIKKV